VRVIYNDTVVSDEGKKYWTDAARDAFRKHWQRQASGKGADVHADDEGAEDLIQINVEGVTPLYSNDVKDYLDHLKNNPRNGGDVMQTGILETDVKTPPSGKGWVVEVRGYTFHKDRSQFLINTLVANLAARAQKQEASASGSKTPAAEAPKQPEKAQAKPDAAKADASKKAEPAPPSKKIDAAELEEAWTKVIPGKVSHVALYDFNPNLDGTTTYALGSVVTKIVSSAGGAGGQPAGQPGPGPRGGGIGISLAGGGGPASGGGDRVGNWTPLGPLESQGAGGVRNVSVAISGNRGAPAASRRSRAVPGGDSGGASGSSASNKDQKAKPNIARTDFIVLFIWKEPTPSDERRGGK
jgi:hypothetical protein